MSSMKVWAVVALVAVAAGSALAQSPTPGGVEAPPGFMDVPVPWSDDTVTVDRSYYVEHPEQRGLQATVAANREVLRDHDRNLCDLDHRVNTLETRSAEGSTPTQPLGGEGKKTPAEPAKGGSSMNDAAVVAGLVTVGGFAVLGVVGVLVWIAVNTGRRDENYGLGTLNQALILGDGEVRGSATAPDGRSVAFRVAGIDPAARAVALATAQAAAPAPQPAPAPQAPLAPAPPAPSQAAIAAATAGLARAGWTNIRLAAVMWVANIVEVARVVNDPNAIDTIIAAEQAAGRI